MMLIGLSVNKCLYNINDDCFFGGQHLFNRFRNIMKQMKDRKRISCKFLVMFHPHIIITAGNDASASGGVVTPQNDAWLS